MAATAVETAALDRVVREHAEALEARIRARTSELEEANRALEAASRHKSAFLANVSRELRTPLNAIIGFTRLVLRKAGPEMAPLQRDNLRKVLVIAEHLLGLINGLLDLSKIEAGRMDVVVERFPIEEVIDEVGDMPLDLQSRLLRFLQEREFERVGGTKPIAVDVRVIAATNRDLEAEVRQRRFREDLYYRLNVVPIVLPPLRARRGDVPALARFFLERFAREAKTPVPAIAPEAMERLVAYDWPGNVRELANLMERAVVLGEGATITTAALPDRLLARRPGEPADGLPYHDAIDAYRRQIIAAALQRAGGNRAAAARALGLQRTYLSKLIRSLGIR
ncbi:MAG TPA: sigma 54-interacting transcriptional regulator [Thermodesulfobacteriota bacterium]